MARSRSRRLTRKHRQAIARGVRRYWRRVKTTARERNISLRDARQSLKLQRQEIERARKAARAPFTGWNSPDPEGEAAFNLQDRDNLDPRPWEPSLGERFRGFTRVRIQGYWEYRASPQSPAQSAEFEAEFDPGPTIESFWSGYFEAIRDVHDEVVEDEKYERFAIFVTRLS